MMVGVGAKGAHATARTTGRSAKGRDAHAGHAPYLRLPTTVRNEMTVGLCVPCSGSAGIWGPSALASAQLALGELNAKAGIASRPCRLVVVNAADDSPSIEHDLRDAVRTQGVEALVGMHTSAVRDRIIRVVGGLLPFVYTPLYEGGQTTPGVFAIGETPSQQLRPAIDWLSHHCCAKRWVFVGNDYVWPRVSNRLARDYVVAAGGQVLADCYLPVGTADFARTIELVRQTQASAVLVSLVGQDAVEFNRQFGQAGLSGRAVRLSCAIEENVLLGIGSAHTEGLYVASSYFSALQTDGNLALKERYSKCYGARAPTLNALGQSTYEGLHFLAALCAKNLHEPGNWDRAGRSMIRYQSARDAVYAGNDYKRAPMYLARAAGHLFEIVTRL